MKLAKIFVPISFVGFLGLIIIMWAVFGMGPFAGEIGGEGADAIGTGIGLAISALLIVVLDVVATIIFSGYTLGVLICWICIFTGRNKFAALTGALVLLSLALPLIIFATILTIMMYIAVSPIGLVVALFCLLSFLTSFVGVCVAYGKAKSLRNQESLPKEEA